MAFTTAQLSAAITSSQTTFGLQNISTYQGGLPPVGALPLPIGFPMLIDGEYMVCYNQPVAGTVQVRMRGWDGTAAVAHDILANVSVSALASDFGPLNATQTTTQDITNDVAIALGQDGTVALPVGNSIYFINKVTAIALTLPAPIATANGLTLIITSTTAASHIVTATGLFMDGVGTVPHSTATYVAKQGASMSLVAQNGFWNVQALQDVTIS